MSYRVSYSRRRAAREFDDRSLGYSDGRHLECRHKDPSRNLKGAFNDRVALALSVTVIVSMYT